MEYYKHYQLKNCNSFRTEAYAKIFCQPSSLEDIRECLKLYSDEQKLILGGGCNVFFTKDFDGVVMKPNLFGLHDASAEEENEEDVFIEAMASEDWDTFVKYTVENGFSGLENLSFIPGTVGAAPVQNIGAYGAEVKDCIREVVALDMDSGEVVSFLNPECEFDYRDSIFKRTGRYIIISVVFQLKRTFNYTPKYIDLNEELKSIDQPTARDVREAVIKIRCRKLPDEKVLPNAGSFFKNPYIRKEKAEALKIEYPQLPIYPYKEGLVKIPAAFLIDKSGYKGVRSGDIGTYPNQPLILVNYGDTSGKRIVMFMEKVQNAVFEKFGVQLEPEVRIF